MSRETSLSLLLLQIMPGYYQFRHPHVAKRSVFKDSVHHVRLTKDSRVIMIIMIIMISVVNTSQSVNYR